MNYEEKYQYLDDFISQKIDYHQRQAKLYQYTNRLLVFTGIILSACVTIAGILDQALLAAVISVLTGVTIAVQNAYNYSENIRFHRSLLAQYSRLYTNLKIEVNNEAQLIMLQDYLEDYLVQEGENQPVDDNLKDINMDFKQVGDKAHEEASKTKQESVAEIGEEDVAEDESDKFVARSLQ